MWNFIFQRGNEIVLMFDVHFRITNKCIGTTYVENGIDYFSRVAFDCINNPAGQSWFLLTVQVTSTEAMVYIDGVLAGKITPHYPRFGKAAVFVWNENYHNVAFFKNFEIIPDM